MKPEIRIRTNGTIADITIDGNKLEHVRGYKIEHQAGKLPLISIEYPAIDLEINGHMIPILPDFFKEYYKEKGSLSSDPKSN